MCLLEKSCNLSVFVDINFFGGGIAKLGKIMGGDFQTTKEICDAAKNGDEKALAIINESATRLGQGLSILIDILNPQKIVIGSIFARAEDLFRGPMEKVIAQEALDCSWQVCEVVPAALGESIGDMAAISVAVTGWEDLQNV